MQIELQIYYWLARFTHALAQINMSELYSINGVWKKDVTKQCWGGKAKQSTH